MLGKKTERLQHTSQNKRLQSGGEGLFVFLPARQGVAEAEGGLAHDEVEGVRVHELHRREDLPQRALCQDHHLGRGLKKGRGKKVRVCVVVGDEMEREKRGKSGVGVCKPQEAPPRRAPAAA